MKKRLTHRNIGKLMDYFYKKDVIISSIGGGSGDMLYDITINNIDTGIHLVVPVYTRKQPTELWRDSKVIEKCKSVKKCIKLIEKHLNKELDEIKANNL